MTAQLDGKKARLPTQLPAHLEMEGVILPSRIRQVGVTAMFVESRLRPVDPAARVKVRFEIATRDGRAPVLCDARVTGTDSGALCGVPGLEVEILEMNEGKQAGIYTRYLKWLHFRTLSRES